MKSKNITLTTMLNAPLFAHGGHMYRGVHVRDGYHAGRAIIWLDNRGASLDPRDISFDAEAVAENPQVLEERFRQQLVQVKLNIDDALDAMRDNSGPAVVLVNDLAPAEWTFDTNKDTLTGRTSTVVIVLPDPLGSARFAEMVAREGTTMANWIMRHVEDSEREAGLL